MQKNLCEENEEMREAYLAKELSPEETARFEAHIEACDICREALRQELELNTLLDSMSLEVPPELTEQTLLRIKQERVAKKRKGFFRIAFSAAMLVLVLAVFYKMPNLMRSFDSFDPSKGNNFSGYDAELSGDIQSRVPCESDGIAENQNINSFFDADGYFLGVPYRETSGPLEDAPISGSQDDESVVSGIWDSALPDPVGTEDVTDQIHDDTQTYHISMIRCYLMVDHLPKIMPTVLGEYTYHGYTIYAVNAEEAEKLLSDMEFISEDGETALIFLQP